MAIDFPDKVYMGSFSRGAKFEAVSEDDGLLIKLTRGGADSRAVEIHLHHYLLADILTEWAASLAKQPPMEENHRENLIEALTKVEGSIRGHR